MFQQFLEQGEPCAQCHGVGTIEKNGPHDLEFDSHFPCPTCTNDPRASKGTGVKPRILARCPPARCNTDWLPLDEWNSDHLQLVPVGEAPALASMPSVETLTVWKSYRQRMNELLPVAKSLTVTSAEEKDKMALARTTRMSLRDIRLAIADTHKELKADALKKGQALDKEKRELLAIIEPLETRLLQQEQFEALQLADAKMRLQQEREDMLKPYVTEGMLLLLSNGLTDLTDAEFNKMRDDMETDYVYRMKREAEEKLAAETAAQKDREERAATAAALEAERLANQQLRAQTEKLRVDADRIQAERDRLAAHEQARQTAQEARHGASEAEKVADIVKRLRNPQWPSMSEPYAAILNGDHVRMTLAGLGAHIEQAAKALARSIEHA